MNALIAAVVGGVVSFVALFGGVSAIQNSSSETVSPKDLYTYADE